MRLILRSLGNVSWNEYFQDFTLPYQYQARIAKFFGFHGELWPIHFIYTPFAFKSAMGSYRSVRYLHMQGRLEVSLLCYKSLIYLLI